jgi:hypothetical protein
VSLADIRDISEETDHLRESTVHRLISLQLAVNLERSREHGELKLKASLDASLNIGMRSRHVVRSVNDRDSPFSSHETVVVIVSRQLSPPDRGFRATTP